MQFPTLFRVNGELAMTRLDFVQEHSTVSDTFRQRADLPPGQDIIISIPLGRHVFTCQLPVCLGDHDIDVVLGKDWFDQYRSHAAGLKEVTQVRSP